LIGADAFPLAYNISNVTFLMCFPELHAARIRTGAGLLRSTRRELMVTILAALTFLLNSDFFSMCMTLLLVEGVSLIAFTY
jgi:hypothetical protein